MSGADTHHHPARDEVARLIDSRRYAAYLWAKEHSPTPFDISDLFAKADAILSALSVPDAGVREAVERAPVRFMEDLSPRDQLLRIAEHLEKGGCWGVEGGTPYFNGPDYARYLRRAAKAIPAASPEAIADMPGGSGELARLKIEVAAWRQQAINEGFSHKLAAAYGREEYAKQRAESLDALVATRIGNGLFDDAALSPSPAQEAGLIEVLREVWLEAHETIPPDGKDAAFAALFRILCITSAALSKHSGGER